MKKILLVIGVTFLAGLAVLSRRPEAAAASRLAQVIDYPAPGTVSPSPTTSPTPSRIPSRTLAFGVTPERTGTPDGPLFSYEPTLDITQGPNFFRTEDAAIFDSFATPAVTQTLPATRTPTITRTATVTRTPTPTPTTTLTFTPSATGDTATPTATTTATQLATATATPGAGSGQGMDWKIFGIGFSIPLLVVAAGALVVSLARVRPK